MVGFQTTGMAGSATPASNLKLNWFCGLNCFCDLFDLWNSEVVALCLQSSRQHFCIFPVPTAPATVIVDCRLANGDELYHHPIIANRYHIYVLCIVLQVLLLSECPSNPPNKRALSSRLRTTTTLPPPGRHASHTHSNRHTCTTCVQVVTVFVADLQHRTPTAPTTSTSYVLQSVQPFHHHHLPTVVAVTVAVTLRQ